MFRCLRASCFAAGARERRRGLKRNAVPLRGRGHVSKVSACLVSTNSPLTKLRGPQWRVKWFGNKQRLALPLSPSRSLARSLAHTNTGEHTRARLRTHCTCTVVREPEEGGTICFLIRQLTSYQGYFKYFPTGVVVRRHTDVYCVRVCVWMF